MVTFIDNHHSAVADKRLCLIVGISTYIGANFFIIGDIYYYIRNFFYDTGAIF